MEFDISSLLLDGVEEANFQLPDPNLLRFYNDLAENHIWLEEGISFEESKFFMKWLLAADRDPKETAPIYIHIMCNGGELDIMFSLYEVIKNMRRPIVTINEGRCHSAAFIVFLAGKTRLMRRYAQFVAHEGSAGMGGTHKEIKQATEAYNRSVENMRQIIQAETSIGAEQLKDHFDRESDWYIDYEQAKELGILKEGTYMTTIEHSDRVLEVPLTLPGYAKI